MERVEYPDLGATVYAQGVPAGVLDELPGLYGSLLSTDAWFAAEDRLTPTGACLLETPRHALVFLQSGDTVEILNKEFDIAPECVVRAGRALFRALPGARRIHIEVLFPPAELTVPKRVLYWTDHMVVHLPDSVETYAASLGRRTRKELRQKDRRLREDHPDVSVEVLPPGVETDELVAASVEWKNRRFNAQGRTTVWQEKPGDVWTFAEVARRSCEARVTRIEGRAAAVDFVAPVGRSLYAYQSAFDPEFEQYSLGLLSTYGLICDAVLRGCTRVSLLWGTPEYKMRLGAMPLRATRLSLFPTQLARLYSLDEAWEVTRRNARRRGQAEYWRLRHAAGRLARTAARRVRRAPAP